MIKPPKTDFVIDRSYRKPGLSADVKLLLVGLAAFWTTLAWFVLR